MSSLAGTSARNGRDLNAVTSGRSPQPTSMWEGVASPWTIARNGPGFLNMTPGGRVPPDRGPGSGSPGGSTAGPVIE